MSARRLIDLLCVAAVASPALAEPGEAYFDRRAEGWFWYQDPPAPLEAEPPEAPMLLQPPAAAEPVPDPVATLDDLKARLEHALAAAIMDPSEANMRTYMHLDQAARNRARRFADTWQRVVWSTPALDHRLVRPVNDQAVQVFNDDRVRLLDARLRDVSARFFLALDGASFGRCDLRVDEKGVPHMLEINPNCGVYYPSSAPGSADLCLARDPEDHFGFTRRIVKAAFRRHERRSAQGASELSALQPVLDPLDQAGRKDPSSL